MSLRRPRFVAASIGCLLVGAALVCALILLDSRPVAPIRRYAIPPGDGYAWIGSDHLLVIPDSGSETVLRLIDLRTNQERHINRPRTRSRDTLVGLRSSLDGRWIAWPGRGATYCLASGQLQELVRALPVKHAGE